MRKKNIILFIRLRQWRIRSFLSAFSASYWGRELWQLMLRRILVSDYSFSCCVAPMSSLIKTYLKNILLNHFYGFHLEKEHTYLNSKMPKIPYLFGVEGYMCITTYELSHFKLITSSPRFKSGPEFSQYTLTAMKEIKLTITIRI